MCDNKEKECLHPSVRVRLHAVLHVSFLKFIYLYYTYLTQYFTSKWHAWKLVDWLSVYTKISSIKTNQQWSFTRCLEFSMVLPDNIRYKHCHAEYCVNTVHSWWIQTRQYYQDRIKAGVDGIVPVLI